eukprot:CAMPEP_0197945436 /NCGR_PEP_ID=MMETSP1439-20131203/125909_1 /TAXON_ID=66791 /ORGANISM="Gonyaulax spinifera, Strain CCMP409" /LENGTH=702 /DNA_ID=CAMNT_0043568691 /DNA_START=211 /DNA_END=2319 /DNA_ORIENTATION=-
MASNPVDMPRGVGAKYGALAKEGLLHSSFNWSESVPAWTPLQLIEVGRKVVESGHLQSLMPNVNFTNLLRSASQPLPSTFASKFRSALLEASKVKINSLQEASDVITSDSAGNGENEVAQAISENMKYEESSTGHVMIRFGHKIVLPGVKGVIAVQLLLRLMKTELIPKPTLKDFAKIEQGSWRLKCGAGVYTVTTELTPCPSFSFGQGISFRVGEGLAKDDNWEMSDDITWGGCFDQQYARQFSLGLSSKVDFKARVCGGDKHRWEKSTGGKTHKQWIDLEVSRTQAELNTQDDDSSLEITDSLKYSFKQLAKDDWILNSFAIKKSWVPDNGRECWLNNMLSKMSKQASASDKDNTQEQSDQEDSLFDSRVEPEVYILATRHGVSCANVAQQWNNFTRGLSHNIIKDPGLSGFGIHEAEVASSQTQEWLEKKGWGVDIVVSSVLMRAMETAIYQFPTTEPTQTIYVAPYIREHGPMLDNKARGDDEQEARLPSNISRRVVINRTFAKQVGQYKSGKWSDFLKFLAQVLLPQGFPKLIAERTGIMASDRKKPIVIAVVTHSLFMAKDLGTECGRFFPERGGKKKPLNNQVVGVRYKLKGGNLVPGGECEPVVSGSSYHKEDGTLKTLCKYDIGERCTKEIPDYSMPTTLDYYLEKDLALNKKTLAENPGKKLKKVKDAVEKLEQAVKTVSEKGCWVDANRPE